MDKEIRLQIIGASICVIISFILMLVGFIMPFFWVKILICVMLECSLLITLFVSIKKRTSKK